MFLVTNHDPSLRSSALQLPTQDFQETSFPMSLRGSTRPGRLRYNLHETMVDLEKTALSSGLGKVPKIFFYPSVFLLRFRYR